MRVYTLRADSDRYRSFIMPNGDLYEFAGRFEGTPVKCPPKGRIEVDPDSYSLPRGDFPSLLPSIPIFSLRAISALGDLLKGNGEVLAIKCDGEEYFLFNVTRVVDALDESNSEIVRFKGTSRVLNIRNYVFFKEKLPGLAIFKIPQDSAVFVTDKFTDRVRSARLKGFWFPLAWSSE